MIKTLYRSLFVLAAVLFFAFPFVTNAFEDGDLVNDNGTIYTLELSLKRGFTSFKVFSDLGYKLSNVKVGNLSTVGFGQNISSAEVRHPRGTVVNYKGTLYFMGKDFRYGYPSESVYFSWQKDYLGVVPANVFDLQVPEGPPSAMNPGFIQPITQQPVQSTPSSGSNSYDSASLAAKNIYVLSDDGTLIGQNDSVIVDRVVSNFYKNHPNKDIYDFVNIFNTFIDSTQPHLHYQVRNSVTGIGKNIFDISSAFGNSTKLLGVNYMNSTFTTAGQTSPSLIQTNFDVFTHEIEHQWAMYIGDRFTCTTDCSSQWKFRSDDGSHFSRWANTSFVLNGKILGDLSGGGSWADNGNGTYTFSNIAYQGLSPLALYLMGLLPPESVPNFTFVQPDIYDTSQTTVSGIMKTITIQDIINKYGPRNPSYANSQKDFKMAYIILARQGEQPTKEQLDAIYYIANNYPQHWSIQTRGISRMNQ